MLSPMRGGGSLDGVAGEMGVAGRRLNLRVAQQFPDHRQPLAERQRARGKAVPYIL